MLSIVNKFVDELVKEFNARADAYRDVVSGGGLDGDREFKDAAIIMGSIMRTIANSIDSAWKRARG